MPPVHARLPIPSFWSALRGPIALSLLILVMGMASEATAQRGPVAIIAHPGVTADDLSFAQLRNVFLGEQQFWGNGQRITLLVRAPDAYERDLILEEVYEMNERRFRQYWIGKIFRSEVVSGPKVVYSAEMAHQLAQALPGAITFMRSAEVPAGAHILRIDGKLPGDVGYALQ